MGQAMRLCQWGSVRAIERADGESISAAFAPDEQCPRGGTVVVYDITGAGKVLCDSHYAKLEDLGLIDPLGPPSE